MTEEIENLKKYVSSELRQLRADTQFSQNKVAEEANVNIGTLVRYENNQCSMQLDVILKLLHVYNCNVLIFFKSVYENMHRKENPQEKRE